MTDHTTSTPTFHHYLKNWRKGVILRSKIFGVNLKSLSQITLSKRSLKFSRGCVSSP